MNFQVNDKVKTAATVKPPRFAGRMGWVAELNIQDHEVGVRFGSPLTHNEPSVWFRPTELEAGSSLCVVATAHERATAA